MTSPRNRLRALIACALVLFCVLLGYLIHTDYRVTLKEAETKSQGYAAILEARLDATLRRTDAELQRLARIIPQDALHQKALSRNELVNSLLKSSVIEFKELTGIDIFDSNGEWLYASTAPVRAGTTIADREYFRTLRDNPRNGTVFSDAMIARTTNRRSVAAAHALRDAQGTFRGVLVALIDLESFEKLFLEVDIGAHGAISVFRSDNFMPVMRRPAIPGSKNTPLPPGTPTREAVASGMKSGTFEYVAKVDAIRRIYSFRTVDPYPFYVGVGIATNDALADWKRHSLLVGLTAALLMGLLVAALFKLRRVDADRLALANIVEHSNDAIYSLDLNGKIVSWNAGASKMLGYTAAQAIGKPANFAVPTDDEFAVEDADSRALRGEGVTLESRRVTASGRIIDVLASRSATRDAAGDISGVSVILQDITALKQAQEALQINMERTHGIVASAMDAIVSVNHEQHVVLFNTAAEHMFGYRANQIIGQPLERLIPEPLRAGHHRHVEAFGETKVSARSMGKLGQISGLHADGHVFPIEASISQIGTGIDKVYTVILRDITERVRTEAARLSLEAQLRESHKMQAIGTLAGGVAHEFNNMIATILGNVELARQDTAGNPHAQESLAEIDKAGHRASELVQQMLSFSRRRPTDRKIIDLAPVVTESARLLRSTLPTRVSLQVDCDPNTPSVLADATQIEQILINLATNATQAIGSGTGRITIRLDSVGLDAALARTHPNLLTQLAKHPGLTVRLTVADNGPGMDSVILEHIFEPFFTTKPVNEGTGLGLSVVHGIVQAHDGVIIAQSQPGAGATFSIYLPAATPSAAVTPAAPAPVSSPPVAAESNTAPAPRLLHIDDDPMPLSLYKRFFERRGYHVTAFSDAAAAMQALRAAPDAFDLVLTDYNMPDWSGLDVAREVRHIRADLPVAVLSGFIDEILHGQAVDAGVSEIISKSESVQTVYKAVERLIHRNTKPAAEN